MLSFRISFFLWAIEKKVRFQYQMFCQIKHQYSKTKIQANLVEDKPSKFKVKHWHHLLILHISLKGRCFNKQAFVFEEVNHESGMPTASSQSESVCNTLALGQGWKLKQWRFHSVTWCLCLKKIFHCVQGNLCFQKTWSYQMILEFLIFYPPKLVQLKFNSCCVRKKERSSVTGADHDITQADGYSFYAFKSVK